MTELYGILNFIKEVEGLKNVTRTAWTSEGKQESVAEHSWRLAVFALSLLEYFPGIDMGKVLGMCIIHDFGEIYEGDVSAKYESDPDGKLKREAEAVGKLVRELPENLKFRFTELWNEYNSASTVESKLVKALDKLETIMQHNQGRNPADFDYEFNLSYGNTYMDFNEVIKNIRDQIDTDTKEKCHREE
ncbi:MAG: putative superfamily hydrolase [Eubacterium sp.]|jgi:putative hydrolase of HD superfamily|nr:putative superfamily hydrolase [Eubacterium sp.]